MSYNSISFGLLTSDVVGFTEAQRTSVELQASISIVSEGTLEYKNFRYPRFKNFYGYCQIMSGAFVIESIPLNYLNQELYHYQQSSTEILQSIGCATKKILAALTPPSTAEVTVALLRNRVTSIRFRLLPNVLANFNLTWHFTELLCDETLVPPPAAQGNPPSPNNDSYNPGARPGDQGGDPKDNSPNDGQQPGPEQSAPPDPGGASPTAQWRVIVSGKDNPPSCAPITGTYNSNVTDPAARFSATIIADPAGGKGCGGDVKQLSVTVNGSPLGSADAVRAIDMVIVNIGYY